MNRTDRMVGVAHTCVRLMEGLLRIRALPVDDSPSVSSAHRELEELVSEIDDVEDIAFVFLHLVRLADVMGMSPSVGDVPEDVVTADVSAGLELLQKLEGHRDSSVSFRAAAFAGSMIMDYAFSTAEPFLEEMSDDEKSEAVRSAMLIAENSSRAMDPTMRADAGLATLRALTSTLETAVASMKEDDDVEDTDG